MKYEKSLGSVARDTMIHAALPDFPHFVATNAYGKYCVPLAFAHREVPTLLADGGVYEPQTLNRLRTVYRGGDIVSGGAFVGDFFPALCEMLDPAARLLSFEPHPMTFAAAKGTISLNNLQNVDLFQLGVGASAGTLPLQIARPNGKPLAAAARLVEDDDFASKDYIIPVEIVRLDDLVPEDRNVAILHLDIEGHEAAALRGATALLQRCQPVVVLETARRKRAVAIANYLDLLNDLAPAAEYRVETVIEAEGNAFFHPNRPL